MPFSGFRSGSVSCVAESAGDGVAQRQFAGADPRLGQRHLGGRAWPEERCRESLAATTGEIGLPPSTRTRIRLAAKARGTAMVNWSTGSWAIE